MNRFPCLTAVSLAFGVGCTALPKGVETNPAVAPYRPPADDFDDVSYRHGKETMKEGREVFRQDTFGSEAFWGGKLQLHKAILGAKKGGIGPGLTPRQALQLGLKVDV